MTDIETLQTKVKEQGELVRNLKAAKKVTITLMRPLAEPVTFPKTLSMYNTFHEKIFPSFPISQMQHMLMVSNLPCS